ncbi:MAG: aminotransferase class I/II-fold pyridoxal phosphate-dependent enzyme [Gammaproteobacteria bacterium]
MKFSRIAEAIRTSRILEVAAEINARNARGEGIDNLTIGDFDPEIFPIPHALAAAVADAYRGRQTNYPGAAGMPHLRGAVAAMLRRQCAVELHADDILIAAGARPLIYALYRSVLDAGECVVTPAPSWNNAAYAGLAGARVVEIECGADNCFMPRAEQLAPHLGEAALLALCSPQNPTGTLFAEDNLRAICELVVAENRRRGSGRKPLYVLFDQIYWALTFGGAFRHPLALCPQIGEYAVFVDGMSKAYAATGLRVGWASGARALLAKMSSFIAHMGAWAPRPEQVAAGVFLEETRAGEEYLERFRARLSARLSAFHAGLLAIKARGHDIDAIAPQAAIYLSVKIAMPGDSKRAPRDDDAVREHLLNEAKIGILPFSWFGARAAAGWFRLSVGACRRARIPEILARLENALDNAA